MSDEATLPPVMAVREELRELLRNTIADAGTDMDSGGGMAEADLWVWIGGREFLITIRESGKPEAARDDR